MFLRFVLATRTGCARPLLSRLLLPVAALLSLVAPARAASEAPAATGSAVPARVSVAALLSDDAALRQWVARHSPDLGAADTRVRQTRALLEASGEWQNPTLNLGLNNLTLGERNPAEIPYSDTLAYQVGLSQTFELGKRGPRVRAARYRHDASLESYRDTFAGLVNDARLALARVAYLAARQRILEERLDSARRIADLEKARLDRGDMSGIDYDRLVLDALQVQEDVADNRSDLEAGLADCSALLFANCSLGDAGVDAVEAAALAPPAAPALDRALQERADLRALHASEQAAREDARLWRRQAIPDPTFGVTYTHDRLVLAGNQPNTLSVFASIPLPVLSHGHYQAIEAEQRAAELGFQARALEQRARADAKTLFSRLSLLENKLETIEKQALPRSSGVVSSSSVAYERGQISLTDLLLARREHASLLLEQADTRYALFTVRNALRRVLGLDAPESSPAKEN